MGVVHRQNNGSFLPKTDQYCKATFVHMKIRVAKIGVSYMYIPKINV
jgi:hypothetical protein